MELINEINQIKKIMGLSHLNEAAGGWLDDLFKAVKSLLTTTIKDKATLKYFINQGLDSVPTLKTAITSNPALGKSLKSQLTITKNSLAKTDPNRFLINSRIKEIDAILPKTPKKPVTPKTQTLTLDLDFRTSISSDAKALFGKIGRKIDADELLIIENSADKIYKGVQKLSDKELTIMTNELASLKVNIQDAITKLNLSKNIKSQEKAKILQNKLNSIQKSWKSVTDNLDKVPLGKSLKVLTKYTIALVVLASLVGLGFTLKNTWVGRQLGALISNIPAPELDNSTGNTDSSNNKGGKKNIKDY
jgi:hypothetical protein